MECLGGLKSVIMLDRNPAIVAIVAQVYGKEYRMYCLCHLTENFLKEATKYGIRKEVTNQIMKELRCYKSKLGAWVYDNVPEQWVVSKFRKER